MTDEQFNPQDEEIEIEAIGVEVSCQPIELYKVLKIANAVSGGGEAKHVISEGYVFVNGDVETRKRCKVFDGDLIEFNQEFYLVICDAPVTEPESFDTQPELASSHKPTKTQKKSSANTSAKSKLSKNNKTVSGQKKAKNDKKSPQSDSKSPSGRSAIRFF
ncbi:urease [Vibrio cholerae]|uniref:RNA-binding S4 domain-containing protein n=1 Tax=Vibrio cholerae TaxID=666 RepID=UPI0006E6A7EE|nr:RNA-binding S4 domain-containing protein [Vibrio cholerae]EHY0934105.1 RNA-binding S4 domain-containing protein [Vibrio cholerae]EJL6597183.1 RNA-binding S4 domain-containing protein [Vibrio cholerae]EJL6615101.1 RNA-binding S4 domain-containing protein [Vibrio cholerae]EKF9831407.1 RNA-binding S4 domain-containing protein [Vibrio cholerae]KQA49347.1 Urease [Vibrio cholerae]